MEPPLAAKPAHRGAPAPVFPGGPQPSQPSQPPPPPQPPQPPQPFQPSALGAQAAATDAPRWDGAALASLVDAPTGARLARALAGHDESRRLRLGELQPGDAGVVEAVVRQVAPPRSYARKRGGNGLLAKVTLADATGEANLVLWDEETRLLASGPFEPGALVRIQGASVRAGRMGPPELALGSALATRLAQAAPAAVDVTGTLVGVGPTRVVGSPPRVRFQADIQVQAVGGLVHVAAEGPVVRDLQGVLPGLRVRFSGVSPHPLLDGWYLSGPDTRLSRA